MPKIRDRKIDKALELKRLLETGPSFGLELLGSTYGLKQDTDQREIERRFERAARRWLTSWVIPLTKELVPEFKNEIIKLGGD